LLALALITACHRGEKDEPEVQAVVGAKTDKAVVRAFGQVVTAIGVVDARPGTFAALGPPGPTRVAKVFVTEGQRVTRGTPLVEFERAPFEAAAKEAETGLAAAQRTRDRAARLTDAGVLPKKELDQAETELAQTEAAAITARRSLELATLKSPMAGAVTRMSAVVGAPVEVNQPVVEVADPSALDVIFNLTPTEAGLVHLGQPVMISAGEAAGGDSLAAGTVAGVSLSLDTATRSVAVRVTLSHRARILRIGETVFGRITVGVHHDAVVVPGEALVPEGEGFKVFVVDSLGLARAREVKVGSRGEGLVEITEGLSGGETVVTYGAYGIEDSAKIAPTKP
jgi:membrane fusion protein (multidrug efflux system)